MLFRSENGALNDLSIVAIGELYAAKGKGVRIAKHDADEFLALADWCYAFEVEPSKWLITDAGKRFVEARREAAIKAEVEAMEDAPVVTLEFGEAAE